MLLFLVGMMGSGKSTLGRQLAKHLQVPFVDLDEYLEGREGRTIAQIFEQDGPVHFRMLERRALEAVVQEYSQAVVATGGGAPCFHDNMAFINLHGDSVFLDVPVEEILRRLVATDLRTRPLLANKSEAELNLFLTSTLAERRAFYEKATYCLSEKVYNIDALLALINSK
ncbi:shikimate kinase [Pontibacter qinzhouensis]|uniref:Shikimate kinase n=1 Tax=Pontibacter qinzhouensis TaxID=2603253 RepID=A0A5C8K873_9BACT|nr:shikimate kinase [Pontibacter qinzhouensis]TXK45360.1 shikimate kinase [Pontibacter qinzhouensis]